MIELRAVDQTIRTVRIWSAVIFQALGELIAVHRFNGLVIRPAPLGPRIGTLLLINRVSVVADTSINGAPCEIGTRVTRIGRSLRRSRLAGEEPVEEMLGHDLDDEPRPVELTRRRCGGGRAHHGEHLILGQIETRARRRDEGHAQGSGTQSHETTDQTLELRVEPPEKNDSHESHRVSKTRDRNRCERDGIYNTGMFLGK